MPRALNEVVFVDGVRTPFGKAGGSGMYAQTRADDLVIRCIRELLRRYLWESPPAPSTEEVAGTLRELGARQWQTTITAPLISLACSEHPRA